MSLGWWSDISQSIVSELRLRSVVLQWKSDRGDVNRQ
jgi:hypothetical protein